MNIKKIKRAILKPFELIKPLKFAYVGMFIITLVIFLFFEINLFRNRSITDILIALGMSIGTIVGGMFIATHFFDGLKKLPSSTVLYVGAPVIMFMLLFTSSRTPIGNYIAVAACIIFMFTFLIEIYRKVIFLKNKERVIKSNILVACHYLGLIVSLIVIVYIFFTDGLNDNLFENAFDSYKTDLVIFEKNPEYKVIKGIYGTTDYLEKYQSEVEIESQTTSLSYFLNSWNSTREGYLGHNIYDAPLNAHFYMPEGEGVYPLVLLVHGNHEMTHDSEIGYDYLGTYLAERGYIVASVDQNFLNYSTYESELMDSNLGSENDARAYVLLSHIKYLTNQNKHKESMFYQNIDLDNIALMGHSRGGEAAAIASFFNKVNYLPNDYRKQLGREYNIKSIVAIAPTDKQYKPGSRPVALENVNYLLLHGSHDMDVTYMAGGNQYERTTFSSGDYFKTSVWIYGANHGQFNEEWHIGDTNYLSGKLHNTGQLINREQQEETASQLIYYFLEATLKDNDVYQEGFKNIKAFKDLPENLYLSQYHQVGDQVIVDYTEDNYLETGTKEGTFIKSSGLSKWYEGTSRLDGKTSMIYGAYIGWEGYLTAEYILDISETDLEFASGDKIYLTLADDTNDAEKSIDLEIELIDENGRVASLPLSSYGTLQHRINIELGKFQMFEDINTKESFFQSFELEIDQFEKEDQFDLNKVEKIVLSLPRGKPRVIFLKDLGLRHQD